MIKVAITQSTGLREKLPYVCFVLFCLVCFLIQFHTISRIYDDDVRTTQDKNGHKTAKRAFWVYQYFIRF